MAVATVAVMEVDTAAAITAEAITVVGIAAVVMATPISVAGIMAAVIFTAEPRISAHSTLSASTVLLPAAAR